MVASGSASDTLCPVFTSFAAAARFASVMKFSAPRSSSFPHLPQLLIFSYKVEISFDDSRLAIPSSPLSDHLISKLLTFRGDQQLKIEKSQPDTRPPSTVRRLLLI